MVFKKQRLTGEHVRLEPITEAHLSGLKAAILDGDLHQLMVTSVPAPDELPSFFAQASEEMSQGASLVFVTIDQKSNKIIGSTRFMNTQWQHKKTEIGFTFIAKSFQRTAVNTEAKYLMLKHAFEQLNFNRVALRTDYLNQESRAAIERLGAKQEGVLRNHMVMRDGRIRDTVVYSIIKNEWLEVKSLLQEKLKN